MCLHHTFKKAERICLKREIEELFSAGSKSFTRYPLRITYLPRQGERNQPRAKVLMSVSKRRLRHAVDRNRAKRQLREAYRLQKAALLNSLPTGRAVNIAFVWLAPRSVSSEVIAKQMKEALHKIAASFPFTEKANHE